MKIKKTFLSIAAVALSLCGIAGGHTAYLFSYSTVKDAGRNGLHLAWSNNGNDWNAIGPEHPFLKCDYSQWGSEKRLVSPFLLQDRSGTWHCLWTLNERDGAIAHAASDDLVKWKRQSYDLVMENGGNCLDIEAVYNSAKDLYEISWLSVSRRGDTAVYTSATKDFSTYTPAVKSDASARKGVRKSVFVAGKYQNGVISTVTSDFVQELINAQKLSAYNAMLTGETASGDAQRFASLKAVDASVKIEPQRAYSISNMLIGVFYEDISYAADGGLYAELVQNRGFEYDPLDTKGRDRSWNAYKSWSIRGEGSMKTDSVSPVHPNTPHYMVVTSAKAGAAALVNEGFGGMPFKRGDKYDFSIFVRGEDGYKGKLEVRLTDKDGKIYGQATTKALSGKWTKLTATLTSNGEVADGRLEVIPTAAGTVAVDMVSLFPQKTYKGRKNGLRADLVEAIADMKPRFVRFPGGCVAHGFGIENIYHWKNTVGPLEARKPQMNIWNYHQSMGLGYFEYFQLCEDIGAAPLPVIAAGVPCQNSAHGHYPLGGQQGGIPMDQMDEYVQDVLDLVEWANGDKNTKWGRVRAEAGHPEPFGLKYIGVGNEDQITDVFEERFTMIFNALKEKHPEITVIGTAGPFFEGTDYEEGWAVGRKLNVPILDEHYYTTPGWFINNQQYYDKYDRNGPKVYLGEYAAHLPGRPSNIETALSEALYLTAIERNGDVVEMTSYAPLLAKEGFTRWSPDLIYFNNTEVKPTVNYFVQKLYGVNAGDSYLPSTVSLSNEQDAVRKRIGISVVKDSISGDVILKMVNMLPVSVKVSVDSGGAVKSGSGAEKTVLTGSPGEKNARPVVEQIIVGDDMSYELPAYSFVVVRCLAKKVPSGTPQK